MLYCLQHSGNVLDHFKNVCSRSHANCVLSFQPSVTLTTIFLHMGVVGDATCCVFYRMSLGHTADKQWIIKTTTKSVYTKDSISVVQHTETGHAFHVKVHNTIMQGVTARLPNYSLHHLVVNKYLFHKMCLSIKFLPLKFYLAKRLGCFIRRQNISV